MTAWAANTHAAQTSLAIVGIGGHAIVLNPAQQPQCSPSAAAPGTTAHPTFPAACDCARFAGSTCGGYTPGGGMGDEVGVFRIAKRFEVETGHRLWKHPEKCRFPHGHTRTVEVVLTAEGLDDSDMVCDYKALKTVVLAELERFDHAMLLAADDPERDAFAPFAERLVLLTEGDPTTEVLARHLFEKVRDAFHPGMAVTTADGVTYTVPATVHVERVRVWETSTTWAEYGEA